MSRIISAALKGKRLFHTTTCNGNSALYIIGQKASETFAYLTPHLDCDSKFQNISKLKENISARGLDIDIDKLKKSWEFLNSVKETRVQLETQKEETTRKIKAIIRQKSENAEAEIKSLKILGKLIRDNLKEISREIWDLEESVIIRILSLPNDLHPETPTDTEIVVSEHGDKPALSQPSLSHVDIGQNLGILKYFNPTCFYLEKAAAEFEISLTQYIDQFLHQKQFIQTSNSDFTTSLVVEGCGRNHRDPKSSFILNTVEEKHNEDASIHLVGGASVSSFSALFTKHETMIQDSVKLFSIGRHYSPPTDNPQPSLFNVAQETTADVFVVTTNAEQQMLDSLNEVLDTITQLYVSLDLHVRVVKCSARQLKSWESLKFFIQMYSPHVQSYVTVGFVSACDTYISKRLLMKYQDHEGIKDFLNVITARVASVPRILACLLEHHNDIKIPTKLRNVL